MKEPRLADIQQMYMKLGGTEEAFRNLINQSRLKDLDSFLAFAFLYDLARGRARLSSKATNRLGGRPPADEKAIAEFLEIETRYPADARRSVPAIARSMAAARRRQESSIKTKSETNSILRRYYRVSETADRLPPPPDITDLDYIKDALRNALAKRRKDETARRAQRERSRTRSEPFRE